MHQTLTVWQSDDQKQDELQQKKWLFLLLLLLLILAELVVDFLLTRSEFDYGISDDNKVFIICLANL